MSHLLPTRLGRSVLVLLGVVVLSMTIACSADDTALPDDLIIGTLPTATDRANCTDPTGDISRLVAETAGALSEPAGVDLVEAHAKVDDTTMAVTFTAAGPIGEVADPIYSLIHGVSGQEESFELRALPASNGVWKLALITWQKEAGGLRESDPQPLDDVPVKVDGNTLSYVVPLREIPKLVTIVWQFGASGTLPPPPGSTTRERVFDDCNNMAQQTGPGSSVPSEPSGPSDGQGAALGTAQTTTAEVTVTVSAFEKPPADPEPLETPPAEGFEVAVVEAEVCAGGQDVTIQSGSFSLLSSESELWPPSDPPQAAALPAFSAAGTLPAGSCTKGWITYEVPIAAQITDVVFALVSGGSGSDTLLWSV